VTNATNPSCRRRQSNALQKLPTNRVLSVRQPFANLLVLPHESGLPLKWCENRSWEPTERQLRELPRGSDGYPRLLIHAAGTRTPLAWHPDFGSNDHPIIYSAIIGHVRLLGFVATHQREDDDVYNDIDLTFWEANSPIPGHGSHHISAGSILWLMDSPVMLEVPIPVKGQCNLWTFQG